MKISYKNGKAGKIHIYIADAYAMTVDDTFWFSEKWHKAEEINDEELTDLTLAVSSRRAFLCGADLLTYRAHGKKELERKLCRKFSKEAAAAAVDKLEELGLICDTDYAHMLAEELHTYKKYGAARIKQELMHRGIDRQIAEDAVEKLDKDDLIRIIVLLQTKYANYLQDEKGIRRTRNALARLGYSYTDIRAAFEQIGKEAEDCYDG